MSDEIVDKAFLDDVLKNPWKTTPIDVKTMAETILAERAEREKNPGVWDGAPGKSTRAIINFYSVNEFCKPFLGQKEHTRELPKTRAREIAEKEAEVAGQCFELGESEIKKLANGIEAAILEYAEREK